MEEFQSEIVKIQAGFKKREVKLRTLEGSAFPQLIVTVPESWESIQLAPLYDVHLGSGEMDLALFEEHMDWIKKTKNVLTWNGGDICENANKYSPGASVTTQKIQPQEQLYEAARILAPIQHKLLFAIPGNHEDRTFSAAGIDSAKFLAENLQLPYFPDYCFCTIKWRGNNFRIMAHHDSGASSTPGAQRNAARKDLPWAGKMDLVWTGHLHQPMTDLVFQAEYDQKTGELIERNSLVIISPSYLKYFGGYAAKRRMAPGVRGLGVAILNANGRIDASMHARGKRL